MDNIFTVLSTALLQIIHPVFSALAPFLAGLLLAWFFHPAVEWLKPKFGTGWSIFITYSSALFTLTVCAVGFVLLILGALPSGDLAETVSAVTDYFQEGLRSVADFAANLPIDIFSDMKYAESDLRNWISRQFSLEAIVSAAAAFSGTAVTLILGIIISVYLLKDRDFFVQAANHFLALVLTQKTHGILCELLCEINQIIYAFLKGVLIDSFIIAFLSSAALFLADINFAVIIGIFAGLFNIIPYFGPVIGMAAAFLTVFFQSGLSKALLAVLFLFIIQQIDSNYIYPRIVGSSTGLHPLYILLSVSIFGYFFGLIGMLLAVPLAGIAQIFIRRWAYR